jgi:hypothetical protein
MRQFGSIPLPHPSAVRERLARNLRENRLLRALLRLSERVAEESLREQTDEVRQQPNVQEVSL